MSDVLGLPVPSDAQTLKLYQKNLFSNVLPSDESQQIVVVGDTSTGKSTSINFLLGFPINFEAKGVGTRRPCVIELVKDANCEEVMYEVNFPKWKEPINRKQTPDVEEVAQMVTNANNPEQKPWYFECLVKDPKLDIDFAFDADPIYVTIKHTSFQYPLRLVDLPGLTRKCNGPMEIAKRYIQPGNICILIMGADNPANGGFPDLAERMCDCNQVLFVQNFAMKQMEKGDVEENIKEIKKIMTAQAAKGNENAARMLKEGPKFYMTDYGLPCKDELKARGAWKAGRDQENWVDIASEKGCQAVQSAMYTHAQMWAKLMMEEPSNQFYFNTYNTGAGVKDILAKIIDFQFDGIDQKLIQYTKRVEELIVSTEIEREKLEELVATLDNPPQWQNLLSKIALTVSEFLDTTIAIPEEGDGVGGDMREVAKCRKTTKDEAKLREDITEEEEREDERLYGEKKAWFDEATDHKICKLLQEYTGFEYDQELACLRSWYRLLDELTGMLAFQPMQLIGLAEKIQATSVIAQGAMDGTNKTTCMVNLVCTLGTKNNVGVKDMICHFVRRLKKIARRDLKNAMAFVKEDRYNALNDFLDIVDANTEETKKQLYADIEKVLMKHMNDTFKTWTLGVPETDEHGKPKINDWGEPEIKPGSGMCVSAEKNKFGAEEGIMHWLLPFKGHYFNGQIPFKDLELDEELSGQKNPKNIKAPTPVDPTLLEEIANGSAMNASNLINMKMFSLCTENYDVSLTTHSPEIDFSLEAMKLLKAMQGEIANFWASSQISFLQHMKHPGDIMSFCKAKLKSDLKAAGMWAQAQDVDEWAKTILGPHMAVSEIARGFDSYTFPAEMRKNTKEEIEATGRTLPREVTDKLPGRELQWPACPNNVYFKLIDGQLDQRMSVGDTFPSNAKAKMTGDGAWRRLCQEFIYVILQLAMKEVTPVELSLAKASRGKQLMESPMEIVAKLVLHRLSTLGQRGGIVFKYRMLWCYMEIVKHSFSKWQEKMKALYEKNGRSQDFMPKIGEVDGATWVLDAMKQYAEMNLNNLLGQLANKFDELQPFDWTTLNGRLPFGTGTAVRPDHYVYGMSEGRTFQATKADPAKSTKDLEDLWNQPLCWQWEELYANDKYKVVKDEELGGLTLDKETNMAAFATLSSSATETQITMAMNSPDDDPPNGDQQLAGGPFHEMALRVHKSMGANAIDYCRPRIKTMMSHCYQEVFLRDALQGSMNPYYKEKFQPVTEAKIKELGEVTQKVNDYKDTLEIIKSNKISTGKGGGVQISDEAAKRKADKALEDAQKKASQLTDALSLLEETDAQQSQTLEGLQKTNTDFAKTLKKYVALEQLSGWGLSLDRVSVNKIPKEFEEDRFQISAFYFQQPWMGRDIKLVNLPQKVLPYQWIIHSGEQGWASNLEFRTENMYENVLTGDSYGGVKLPMVFPPGEHFLAIELKRAYMTGSKGFFGNNQTRNVEVLCTVIIPYAYALKDKDAWNVLEEAGSWGKFHSAESLAQSVFSQTDRVGAGNPNKTYMFKFEQSMGHYGMTSNKAIEGMELEVVISQNQERAAVAETYAVAPAASVASIGSKKPGYSSSAPKVFVVGQAVDYYSQGKKDWFATQIAKVNSDGTYQVSVKPGANIDKSLLRPAQ
mmetsp:Transcript_143473/g.261003  ORF Transcript_143473/g.261003 Transcript_143473/m.261003 type:complete len:1634 (+) Transcript_143473:69-4970(+)